MRRWSSVVWMLGSAAEQVAWAAIEARQRQDVSRMFANVGKAIAAYEKTLQHAPTRLDAYVEAVLRGDAAAGGLLRRDEARGLRLSIGKAQCVSCHNGPLMSDQQFHNTGVPPRDVARPDRGRAAATAKVLDDEFNCLGPFDAEVADLVRFFDTLNADPKSNPNPGDAHERR